MGVLGPDGCASSTGYEYQHDAFFYDDDDALARIAAPFLLDGLAAGEATVVAAAPRSAAVLREAVGNHPLVHVVHRDQVFRTRTPMALTASRRLADHYAAEGVRRVRVVGEVDFGTTEREWLEWQRFEAVVNQALAGWPLWGLCLFDTQRLPQPLLDCATATHATLRGPGGTTANPDFVDPPVYLRGLPNPVEPLEATAPRLSAPDVSDFVGLRHAVATELAATGAGPHLVEDFLLAVDEMVSNAVRHGLPPVSLRLWTAEDRIVCTIGDGGPGWDDPFAGYGPAHGDDLARGGMGLWLARQLCDHVDISGGHGGPGDAGVSVRLTVRLP